MLDSIFKMKDVFRLFLIWLTSGALACSTLGAHPSTHAGPPPVTEQEVVDMHNHAKSWSHLSQHGCTNSGNDIQLINTSPPGYMPSATVEHYWAYGAGHPISYSQSTVVLTTPRETRLINPGAQFLPKITIDPENYGRSGRIMVTIIHNSTGAVLERHTASWNFDASSCLPCATGDCDVDARIGSVEFEIPLGNVAFGKSNDLLIYKSSSLANQGASNLKYRGQTGTYGSTVATSSGGVITSVTTGNSVATVVPSASAGDPNKFSVLFTYINDPRPSPPDPVYREVTVQMRDGNLEVTDTANGVAKTRIFSNPDPSVWTMVENGMRKHTRTEMFNDGAERIYHFNIQELGSDSNWHSVSIFRRHDRRYSWGWETVKVVRDPNGVAAVTETDYYRNQGSPLHPKPSLGKIKTETFPTGLIRRYEYLESDPYLPGFSSVDIIKEHFAGMEDGQETRLHRKIEGAVTTVLEEKWVLGELVSKKEVISNSLSRTEKVYPSATAAPLVTVFSHSGAVRDVLFPDGTVERVTEAVNNGNLIETTRRGTKNTGAGHFLTRGSESVRVLSKSGAVQRSTSYWIENASAHRIREHVVAQKDHLERPERVDVFHGSGASPTYTHILAYSCCGLSYEVGQDGLATHYYRDGLGRLRKTHRNGFAEETVFDGLATRYHRYTEGIPVSASAADPGNEISNVIRNLAGLVVASHERSPESGSLVQTLSQTSFNIGDGVGIRVASTYPPTDDDQGVPATLVQDYYPDGKQKSVTGTLEVNRGFTYSATSIGLVESQSLLTGGGAPFEGETIQYDGAQRPVTITYAGDKNGDQLPDQTIFTYHGNGRIKSETDPDGVVNLFDFNAATGIETSAVDLNSNGVIDPSVDRISFSKEGAGLNSASKIVWRGEVWVRGPGAGGQSTDILVSREERSPDGLEFWIREFGGGQAVTFGSTTRMNAGQAGSWATTRVFGDGSFAIDRFVDGRIAAQEEYSAPGLLQASRQYSTDDLGRVVAISDSTGPSTTIEYVSPLVDLVRRMSVGNDEWVAAYDDRERLVSEDSPDTLDAAGSTVTNTRHYDYWVDGSLREASGTPGYPAAYTYDDARRLQTMTTFGTTPATTRWEYDTDRGWLIAKRQNSSAPGQGSGETYAYTPGGRLSVRTLARNIQISHDYDESGLLSRTDYGDGTPSTIVHERDQLGRERRLSDATGERIRSYDAWGDLSAETYSAGGVLGNWAITQARDGAGRLSGLGVGLAGSGTSQHFVDYDYDPSGRLKSVSSSDKTASYGYQAAHQRLEQLAISVGGSPVLYGSFQYDSQRHLQRISYHNGQLASGFNVYSDHAYTRDAAGKVISETARDRTRAAFEYNPAGELVAAKRFESATGSNTLAGQKFQWSFDGIGNRLSASRGGDSSGNNLRQNLYTPTALNLPASVQNTAAVDVSGMAAAASVTVNGTAASRQGPYFHREVPADNSAGAAWLPVVIEDGTEVRSGSLAIPPANESFTYDADGNLLSDGIRGYTWDAANRLIRIETLAAAASAGVPYLRVEYTYDSESRRVRRQLFDAPAASQAAEDTRYLWAGWRCLGELDAAGALVKRHVWGSGLNQSLHLGDGNGALLWTDEGSQTRFFQYDGNGNVVGLSDAAGTMTAEYRYSPFGELVMKRGSQADANLYRYSTKPMETVAGLYDFGYRHYDPVHGRWLSRDPLEEAGGMNLTGFVGNDPVNHYDVLGLFTTQGQAEQAKLMWAGNAVKWGARGAAAGAAFRVGLQGIEDLGAATHFVKCRRTDMLPHALSPAEEYAEEAAIGAAEGLVTGGVLKGLTSGAQAIGRTPWVRELAGRVATTPWAQAITKAFTTPIKAPWTREAAKVGVCFPSGTPILMADRSTKKIEEIEAGDEVASFDLESREVVSCKVDGVVVNFTYWWVDLKLDDGRNIRATRNHPLWIESLGEWKAAREIEPGMTLRAADGKVLSVVSVAGVTLSVPEPTYNFEVSINHNYFAGDSKVLVHNGADIEAAWFEFQENYHRIQSGHGFDFSDMRHVPTHDDYIRGKTPLPADASRMFSDAVYHPRSDSYFGRSKVGKSNLIYKYMSSGNGSYHFTQIIESPRDRKVPKAIAKYFEMLDTGKWPTRKPCY